MQYKTEEELNNEIEKELLDYQEQMNNETEKSNFSWPKAIVLIILLIMFFSPILKMLFI
ncbi:hypothetical protein MUA33_00240 [Staphylococcus delphini]|uniref:hypothetical protein n=1 Tax=Staphylococcus delphini TaxID=53344 RepID=UPI0021D349EF|nr:hypothetical protein [Staphylococcus delphini]UXS29310.1 hypothetical protein MUA33_00240 [Staphylococcus delphini]